VVVDISDTSSAYDLHQSVEFASGAVHLVVIQTVLATHNKVTAGVSVSNSLTRISTECYLAMHDIH